MKTRNIVISALTLLLCTIGVTSSYARYFEKGERLYINGTPSDLDYWGTKWKDDCELWCKLIDGDTNYWIKVGSSSSDWPTGTVYSIVFPEGAARNWNKIRLARYKRDVGANPAYAEGTNQINITGELTIDGEKNYIENFGYGDGWTGSYWSQYIFGPPTGANPSSGKITVDSKEVSEELIEFCPESTGDPFSLTPIFDEGGTDYNYGRSSCHAWYKWNGSSWVLVSGQYAGYKGDGENEWFCKEKLSAATDTYYFLWTNAPSRRRLIHLRRKTSCPVACNITSFRYVTTPVNVNDSTFAFEGSVAFTQAAGNLKISFGSAELVITDPHSPQVFSLPELKADGKTDHLIAQFLGDAGCIADSIATAPTPESGIREYDSKDDPEHYLPSRKTYIHGTDVKLTPSVLEMDSFTWMDVKGTIKKSNLSSGDNTYTVSGFGHDTTLYLYYTEFNQPPVVEDNMMGNGSYESVTAEFDDMSEYDYTKRIESSTYIIWDGESDIANGIDDKRKNVYWFKTGYDPGTGKSYYDSKSGIWGLTKDANIFWERLANISPKHSDYMAVFDGDSGEKIAWQAKTSGNPNLKLQKGTTYMFSFWVANVNNFGEMINFLPDGSRMTNNAILQFKIKYKAKDTGIESEQFLGVATDLNGSEYLNNSWHQNSATFTSPVDADEVTISVVDKNATGMRIGNDFALDDIRFRAVSVQLATVRSRELFVVEYKEPNPELKDLVIEPITYPACGKDTFSLKVRFKYYTETPHTINLTMSVAGFEGTVSDARTLPNTAGEWRDTAFVFSSNTRPAPDITNALIKANGGSMTATVNLSVTDSKGVVRSDEKTSDACGIPATPVLTLKEGHGATSIACGSSTFSVAVKTSYTYFHGDKIRVMWDGAEVTALAETITKRSTSATDYETTITGLTADGKGHTLRVYTDNALDCYQDITVTAPKGNNLTSFTLETLPVGCDATKYTLRANWEVSKPATSVYDTLIIKEGDAIIYRDSVKAAIGSYDLGNYDIGATKKTYTAYLKERAACDPIVVTDYDKPVVPSMEFGDHEFQGVQCNNSTYTLIVPVTYTYQHGKMWAWLDAATYEAATYKVEVTDAGGFDGAAGTGYLADQESSRTTRIKIPNITATGTTHILHVKCDGALSCAKSKTAIPEPDFPTLEVSYYNKPDSILPCGQQTYTIVASVTYTNMTATSAYAWVDPSNKIEITGLTFPNGTNKKVSIPDIPADSLVKTLHVEFGGKGVDCPYSDDFRAPHSPRIDNLTVTGNDAIGCGGSDKFTATINVAMTNPRNQSLTVIINDGTTSTKKTQTVKSNPIPFEFADLPSDGKDYTVTAYFDSVYKKRPDCIKSTTFKAPSLPKAELKNIKYPTTRDCDVDTLHLDFDVYYTYQKGNLDVWVEGIPATKQTLTPAEYGASNPVEDHRHFKMILPADGVNKELHYKFTETGYCFDSKTLTSIPRTPMIDSIKVIGAPASVSCGDNYTANVTVWYHNVLSTDIIVLEYHQKDGTNIKPELTSLIAGSSYVTKSSFTFNHKGFGKDTIYAYFKGETAEACMHEGNHIKEFKTPSTSSIESDFRITTTKRVCGDSTYTVSGKLYFTDAPLGASLILKDDKGVAHTIATGSYTSPQPFALDMKSTGKPTLSAYFSTDAKCPSTCDFDAPPVPDFFVSNMHYKTPKCDDVTDTLVFDLTYTYQDGTLKAWVDGDKLSIPFTKDNPAAQTLTNIEIPGVSANGVEHTLHVQFEGGRCNADSTYTTPKAPFSGRIYTIQPPVISDEACGSNTYSVSVTFDVSDNSVGKAILASCKGITSEPHTAVSGTGKNTIKISGITRATPAATAVEIELYFKTDDRCDPNKSVTYDEKPKPAVGIITLKSDPSVDCADDSYTLKGELTYTNIDAAPQVWWNSSDKKTISTGYTTGASDAKTIEFPITMPADGLSHPIYANVSGWDDGCKISQPYTTVWRPKVGTVSHTLSKSYVHCKESYNVTLTIPYTNGLSGKKINASCTDSGELVSGSDDMSTGSGSASITLSGLKETGGTHDVTIWFEGMEGTCTASYSFKEPTQIIITDFSAAAQPMVCKDTKYKVTGELTTNVAPGKYITIEDAKGNSTKATLKSGTTYEYTLSNVEVTGKGNTLTATFDGVDCYSKTSNTFDQPLKPELVAIIIDDQEGEVACGAANYTLKGAIRYINIDADPYIWLEANGESSAVKVTGTPTMSGDTATLKFSTGVSVTTDGKDHVLHLKAGSSTAECPITQSFKSVWRPAVTKVTPTVKEYVHCNEVPYSVTLKIDYTRGVAGEKIYASCTDDTDKTISGFATLADGNGTATITLSGLKDKNNGAHTLTIYFAGKESCKNTDYTYTAPKATTITLSDVKSNDVTCGATSFSITGTVTANVAGETIVITTDGGKSTEVTSKKDEAVEYTISGLTAAGSVTAQFAGITCSKTAEKSFFKPAIPAISPSDYTYSEPACHDMLTDLTFTLNYTKQKGDLKIYLNDQLQTYSIVEGSYVANSDASKSMKIKVEGLTADSLTRKLRVQFTEACDKTYPAIDATPFSPHVHDSIATISAPVCNEDTYDVTVTFRAANHQSRKVTVECRDQMKTITATNAEMSVTFTGIARTLSNTSDDYAVIYFKDASYCTKKDTVRYMETPAPILGIALAEDPGLVDCNAATYYLKDTLNYTYINQYPKIWLDSEPSITLTQSEVDLKNPVAKQVKLGDLNIEVSADGQTHHLYVQAGGWSAACGTIDKAFTAVWRPQVTAVTPTLSKTYVHCDETYDLNLTVAYERGIAGKKLYASCSDHSTTVSADAPYTLSDGAGTATFKLSGLKDQGHTGHAVKLYFEGLESTCPITSYTYDEPTTIAVTGFTAVEQPKDCGDAYYEVKGTVMTNYATDAKIIVSDGKGHSTSPLAASTTGTDYSLTVYDADMAESDNKLTATFVGHDECIKTLSTAFGKPTTPTASIKTFTANKPSCDVTTFTIDFTLSYVYQKTQVAVWVDDDKKGYHVFDIAEANWNKSTSLEISGKLEAEALIADGSTGHVLHYEFAGDHPCKGQSDLFAFPNTPVISKIDVERPDRILCSDATYGATIKVTTVNAAGEKLIVQYKDKSSVTKCTDAAVVPATNYVEIPVTFDKKDDVTHEIIYVYFDGAGYTACRETDKHKKEFAVPSSSAIKDFVVTINNSTTCDDLSYSLSGIIEYDGSAPGDMIITFDDAHTKDTIIPQANCDPTGTPFTMSGLTKPVTGYNITAHFDGETCTSKSQEFSSPAVPHIDTLHVAYATPECNATTTDLSFTLKYTKQQKNPTSTKPLHIKISGHEVDYTLSEVLLLDDDAENTVTVTIADQAANTDKRNMQIWFDGPNSCDKTFTLPAAPFSPKVALVGTPTVSNEQCNSDTYSVTVKFNVENGLSKPVKAVCKGQEGSIEHADDSQVNTITIDNVPRNSEPNIVEVYFPDATNHATCHQNFAYTQNSRPEAAIAYPSPIVSPACDVTTFNLPFTLDYIYQGEGTLTVWVDEVHKKTYQSEKNQYKALDNSWQQLVDSITGLLADGRTGQKLYFKFDGDHSCDGSTDLEKFPQTPLIESVVVTGVPPYIPGVDGTYKPTVTVQYKNAVGERIVLEYMNKKDEKQYAYSTSTVTGDGTYVFNEASGLPAFDDVTKGSRMVHAYYEGSECQTGGKHDGMYDAPTNSSIKFVSVDSVNNSSCGSLLYDLKGSVSYVGASVGDLIVEFDAAHRDTIAEALCVAGQALSFEIKNIDVPIPTEGKQLKAYFSNLTSNPSYSRNVFQPVIPAIDVPNAGYATPVCNETTISLKFDLEYTRQQGDLHLYLDEVEVPTTDYEITAGAPLTFSDAKQTATIVINNLKADLSVRELRVKFDDDHSCNSTFTMPAAWFSPKVTSTKAEIKDVACDKDTYTLDVTFTVENSLSKDASLKLRGTGTPVTVSTTDGKNYSYSFSGVERTYDKTDDDFVELYFEGNNADCSEPEKISYVETPKPGISLTLKPEDDATACNQETYLLHGTIDYTYLDQAPEIWLNGQDHKPVAVQTMQTDGKQVDLADMGIQVPADGREHHVYIKPNGWTDACAVDVPFNALQQPFVTGAQVVTASVPEFLSCDKTYEAQVTVDYTHAYGKTVTIAYTDNEGNAKSAKSGTITDEGKGSITITLPASGDTGEATALKVYVDDANCAFAGYSFAQPTLNSIIPDFEVSTSANPCGVVDYTVTGTVTFNNAAGLGELIVKYDDSHVATIINQTATSADFRIEHMTTEGDALQLDAYFANAPTCGVQSAEFASPEVPMLTAEISGVDTIFTCGDKSYTVHVSITSDNQTGEGYVLDSIAGGAAATKLTETGTFNGSEEFVIARPMVGETHYVVVRYPATGCEVVVPTPLDINPYTKPEPVIDLLPIERICEKESEIVLPFQIQQGDVNVATLTLDDRKGGTVISDKALTINTGKDTLSYLLTEPLQAGKYTAAVEVRDTLDCLYTTSLPVEVALDGKIYSKWTDVLLIDNADDLYTGYQWYVSDEAGNEQVGDGQVLYSVDTTKIYYCLLTLKDGSQLYTCEYAWGDIMPSVEEQQKDLDSGNQIVVRPNRVRIGGAVTVQQSEPEQLRMVLLSSTGQRIASYTQTKAEQVIEMPSVQGVYMLRIATEKGVQTVKIVVY